MINLLPPELKKSYRFANRNVSLRRWVIACAICFLLIGLIGSYGWLSVRQSIQSSDSEISSIQTNLKRSKLTQTNKQVADIGNSLKLAEKVLSQEILFSKLLRQMATALPQGTSLSSLNITDVSGGSALDVTVDATDYTTATQVQLNLADPKNQIFSKADIQSIACDSTTGQSNEYPCKINLRAQFAPNNQFLLINQGKTTR